MSLARPGLPRASRRLLILRWPWGWLLARSTPGRRGGALAGAWLRLRYELSFCVACARGRYLFDLSSRWLGKLLCRFLVQLPSVRYASSTPLRSGVSSARLVPFNSCTYCQVPRLSELGRGSPARRSAARRHAGSLGALRRRPLLARAANSHRFDASRSGRLKTLGTDTSHGAAPAARAANLHQFDASAHRVIPNSNLLHCA